jgi:large-conductance mechanosensitive channel
MAGASTNIPELLTINRTIGKRAMIMYFFMVTVISNIVGYITNQLLMPGFKPVLDYDASQKTIRAANKLIFTAPLWLKYLCSFVLIAYACVALVRIIKKQIGSQTAELI